MFFSRTCFSHMELNLGSGKQHLLENTEKTEEEKKHLVLSAVDSLLCLGHNQKDSAEHSTTN